MPSIMLSSVGGTGLFTRGAWRSMEASRELMAIRCSQLGGVASALVCTKPSSAKQSPPATSTSKVMMTPRMKFRIFPPTEHSHFWRLQINRCGVAQDSHGIRRIGFADLQLDPAEYMRMTTRNAKHVLILSEALDIGRFEAGTGKQEFSLIEEGGDGHKRFVHHYGLFRQAKFACRSPVNKPLIFSLHGPHRQLWAGNILLVAAKTALECLAQ